MLHRPTHIPTSNDAREHICDLLDEPDSLEHVLPIEVRSTPEISPLVVPESGLLIPNSDTVARRRIVSSRPTSRIRRQLISAGEDLTRKENQSVATHDLIALCHEWNSDLVDSGRSIKTTELRAMLVGRLHWFLQQAGYPVCGTEELQHFFRHLRDGHMLPSGRWGEGAANHGKKPLSTATLATYDRHFRSFFNFLVDCDVIVISPMEFLRKQADTSDQKVPFTLDQVRAFIREASRSKYPKRNEAIVRFLFDTGVRSAELCGLRMGQVDLFQRRARVLGKGNRNRLVTWGKRTGQVLRAYMRDEYFSATDLRPDDPLFLTAEGRYAGDAITYVGLRQLIRKLGDRAGVQVSQCSPHTFRHTFAIVYLRRGGDIQTLQFLMGHSSIKTTQGYVNMAFADIESKHRMYSPGDALEI